MHPLVVGHIIPQPLHPIFRPAIEKTVPKDTRNLITLHPKRIDERLKRRVVHSQVSISLLKEL
jgi:hypothetical protein